MGQNARKWNWTPGHRTDRAETALEESDYGRAYDFAFARSSRRSLVVLFTDLVDPDVSRTRARRPRHLSVVTSLLDEDLQTTSNSGAPGPCTAEAWGYSPPSSVSAAPWTRFVSSHSVRAEATGWSVWRISRLWCTAR
ncbi:cell division protein DivIC (FtsB), stabilizes FtsL against RasP cleavage [Cystobacter fuscus]|uniref:Cell division protein DivIC (FtsB), stabilizes FtsL against RasP cleavage n=1 Tax=Cystobacter fuscus TaxID=43 RepID=A0A250J9M3_9BACT|nr:cell division protein DivIC (FtsB), stabilizes FtsL against RasP cleavage [Cystobacter fuscus]